MQPKYSSPLSFYKDLQKFIQMKRITLDKIKEKLKVYNRVCGLYKKMFENYYDECNESSDLSKEISTIKNSSLKS